MPIFVDPDELKSNSKAVYPDNAIPCPGLEALTGADFAISRLPVPPTASIPVHIKAATLFVQRKSAFDIVSFDNLNNCIARAIAAGIPHRQVVLLFVGDAHSENDNLVIRKSGLSLGGFGEDVSYKTFLKLKAKFRWLAGSLDWIEDESQIPLWIEAQQEALNDIEAIGNRDVYPKRQKPDFEPDNIRGTIIEVPPDDWRHFLCAGLHGFGPKMAIKVQEYLMSQLPHLWGNGYYALRVLTDPIHDIPGWGDKSRNALRKLLGLNPGVQLSIDENKSSFVKGWASFGQAYKEQRGNFSEQELSVWVSLMQEALELEED